MPERPPLREYANSRAVLIGTSEYKHLRPLPAARNSLYRMAGLLTSPLCGWPADRLVILENEFGPGDLPYRLITSLEDATEVALFYYVGHGQTDLENQLCLGLVGSQEKENWRAATSLPFEAVRRAMRDSPAATKIVILDCCYAGVANLPVNSLAGSDDLLDKTTGSGAYTMAAAAANFPARYDTSPDTERPQTFFTQYLVDVVERGISGEPSGLQLHRLFVKVRDLLATDNRPIPVARSVDAAREFVFAHNAAPLEDQRDLGKEVVELSQRLKETEDRERTLRAQFIEQTLELERLQEQARSHPAMPEVQRQELNEAIDEAKRQLEETAAAHEDAIREVTTPTQGDREPTEAPEAVTIVATLATPSSVSETFAAGRPDLPGADESPRGADESAPGGGRHVHAWRRRSSAAAAIAVVIVLATILATSADAPRKLASGPAPSVTRTMTQAAATQTTASVTSAATATATRTPTKTPTPSHTPRRTHSPSPSADSTPSPVTGVSTSQSAPPPATRTPPATTPTPTKSTTKTQRITGYSGATPEGCSSVGSAAGGSQVGYTFHNNSGAPIQVVYLQPDGNPGSSWQVAAHSSFPTVVKIGDAWRVDNSNGCMDIFKITDTGSVTVGDG